MKVETYIWAEDLAQAYEALKKIPGAFPKAVNSAINRTLEGMSTDITRNTKERYFVKSGEIRKTLKLKRASAGNLNGAVVSRGGRRKLSQYKLTPMTPQAGRKKGFKGAVKREGGLKPLPEGTFMINTPNAGPVLFLRVASGRSWANIEHVNSPSIPQIVKNEESVLDVKFRAQERFEKRLEHEVMRILGALP